MDAYFYISEPNSITVKAFCENVNGTFQFSASPFNGAVFTTKMEAVEVKPPTVFHFQNQVPNASSEQEHLDLLRQTVTKIKANNWGKIVVARAEIYQQPINVWVLYKTLVTKYPEACVHLFSSPKTGVWLGATPEVLLSAKNNTVKTMSLAGTRKRGEEATFTAKEEEEQQLVSDYIETILSKQKGLENLTVSEKDSAYAGNLVHFKTSFEANIKTDFTANKLLRQLHPTPAVAGFPKEEAIDFILKNENFDRSFYAGYFGLKKGNDFNYYVNLRCMQVFEKSYALYAGGGITKDSDVHSEWEETVAKMNTLKWVINQL